MKDLKYIDYSDATLGKDLVWEFATPVGDSRFSSYIGSGPASTVHPPKISGISSTPKKFEILATTKNSHYVP